MNTTIIDRWHVAMKATLPWYMGFLDPRNTPAERLYCRMLSVVAQDRIMAEEKTTIALPIWIPRHYEAEVFGDFA